MKKFIAIICGVLLLATASGCGKEAAVPEESLPEEPLSVEITVPAYVVEGLSVKPSLSVKQTGLAPEKNDDDTYTLKMSQSKYDQVIKDCKALTASGLDEFKNGESFTSMKEIQYNDDFSKVTVLVDKAEFESGADLLGTMAIGVTASTYQYLSGVPQDKVRVEIIVQDQVSGKTLVAPVFPDSFS